MICQVVLNFFVEKDTNLYQVHIEVSTPVIYKYRFMIGEVYRASKFRAHRDMYSLTNVLYVDPLIH
jgi:hypothetical protein